MPKTLVTKKKISISLDESLYDELKGHCDENLIKLSTYIEYLLKKGVENERDKGRFK